MSLKTSMKPKKTRRSSMAATPKKKPEKSVEKSAEKSGKLEINTATEFDLNQTKVAPFVDALLKLHSEKRPETNKENDKKSQLFGAEETPIKLQISGIKIPREDRKHFIKV